MRYSIRDRQLLPGDTGCFVVDDAGEIETSFPERAEAEAFAAALNAWEAARPVPGEDRPRWTEPGSLDGILERSLRAEPSAQRLLAYERVRLEVAQRVAA